MLLLGQPRTVVAVLLAVLLWVGLNLGIAALGHRPPDPPPFYWLETVCGVAALVTTLTVLTASNRLLETDEARSRLHLQISLLAERKAAKVVQLLEELRRDLPQVPNRADREAEEAMLPTNPHRVAEELERRMPFGGPEPGAGRAGR